MGIWLCPLFLVIAHGLLGAFLFMCPGHVHWGFLWGLFLWMELRLKECSLSYKWNHCDEVELHETAKLFPEWLCRIFLPISTESACWSMAAPSLDVIRVFNFCKFSGCKRIYFCGVHLTSYLYLFIGHLYFFCEMLFRPFSHFFFLLGYLLYLIDLLKLFLYPEA